jgi:hypothetical protein
MKLRKKQVTSGIEGLALESLQIPPKKEFATMLELLKDAEKYDNENEKEASEAVLTILCEYIERFKEHKNNG